MTQTHFWDFTNLYELSKTLRFELKPIGNTAQNLENDWVVQKDREVEAHYHEIKELLDELHVDFVSKWLENIYLSSLDEFHNVYTSLKQDSKNKKLQAVFSNCVKNLRIELVWFLESEWNKWQKRYNFLKKWWVWFLTEKEVLQLLETIHPDKKVIIWKFDRFFTYFSNFNESRKNFYATDWRSWAIATRAVDENFVTFIENMIKFQNFYENNTEWCNENLSQTEQKIFTLDYYNSCLLQNWIDNYNNIIGQKSEENWNKILGINEKINLYKQSVMHSNSKDKKFPKFDQLYKQILSKIDKENFVQEIESDTELTQLIQWVQSKYYKQIKEFNILLKKFLNEHKSFNTFQVYVSQTAINSLSNILFENWDSLKVYLWNKKQSLYSFWEIHEALQKID